MTQHLHRSTSRRSSSRTKARGVISIETLICLPPLLLTFLAITQLALVHGARLVVQHAATRALRAAIVVADDAPDHYEGASRGLLAHGNGEATARLNAIRSAAYGPLMAVAPALVTGSSSGPLADVLKNSEGQFIAARATLPGSTIVTVHENGSESPSPWVTPKAEVTLRVRLLFPCRVPLASRLLCKDGLGLMLEDFKRLKGAESPTLQGLLLAEGRYLLIEAEATGTLQGATYHSGRGA